MTAWHASTGYRLQTDYRQTTCTGYRPQTIFCNTILINCRLLITDHRSQLQLLVVKELFFLNDVKFVALRSQVVRVFGELYCFSLAIVKQHTRFVHVVSISSDDASVGDDPSGLTENLVQ